MSKKANDFLGVSDSEEDDVQGYNSDEDFSKGGSKGGRTTTRRKASDDESDNDGLSDEEHGDDRFTIDDRFQDAKEFADQEKSSLEDDEDDANEAEEPQSEEKTKTRKELPSKPDTIGAFGTKRNLVQSEAAVKKSGVVYLSRIPPFMKPAKLRNLLQPYGTINRIFLAPEDPEAHARRVRAGGNKKKTFTEGWVEFTKKKEAKAAAELLNGHTIGGKKGSYYRDDLWNLLYLSGYKWHNLTEQIAGENAERESRMRAEMRKTDKENKEFVKNVEMGKMLDGMHAKANSKKRKPEEASSGQAEGERPAKKERTRTFKQAKGVQKASTGEKQSDKVMSTLSKIF